MYYYGARYYAAWTCRFVSVDPLAGKYLEWSPYVYCADNPIKYIDPDGRDWFYNEKTGDIYYNSHLHKGEEKHFATDGWKYLGDDNFFKEKGSKESVDVLLKNNIDLIDGEIVRETPLDSDGNREDLIRATFKGSKARKFMNSMGYDFMPYIADVYLRERYVSDKEDFTMGSTSDFYEEVEKIYKGTYLLKGTKGTFDVIGYYEDCEITRSGNVTIRKWWQVRIYDYNGRGVYSPGNVEKYIQNKLFGETVGRILKMK